MDTLPFTHSINEYSIIYFFFNFFQKPVEGLLFWNSSFGHPQITVKEPKA